MNQHIQEEVIYKENRVKEVEKPKRNRKQSTYLQNSLCFANSTKKKSNFLEPWTLIEAQQCDRSER